MRIVALFFLAFFAVICLNAFVLVHSIDLTLLNEEYVIAKIEEQQLYDKIIDSMSEFGQGGIGAREFIEIIGIDTLKPFVKGIISSVLSYLKDPSVQKIEIGMPQGLFPIDTTISLDALMGEEELDFLRQAKWAIQTMLVTRTIALLLALACIVLIIIVAKGIASKIRWVGFSLAFAGSALLILSLIIQQFLGSMMSELSLPKDAAETLIPFLESLFFGYSSLVQFYGLLLLFGGILAIFLSSPLFSTFFKSKGKKALEEKRELEKKREEIEAKEKGYL